METKRDLLKEVRDRFIFLRDASIEKYGDKQPERTWTFDLIADYFDRIHSASTRGEPVAWLNFAVIPELFWAMDLLPWCWTQ